jgi:endoglucanase
MRWIRSSSGCVCALITMVFCAGMVTPLLAGEDTGSCSRKEVQRYYEYWKGKYLIPSTRFPGDFKVNYDGKGTTVSEAIGYGMMITSFMADEDPAARTYFDGLNRFRKRFPSSVNPAFMCWKIPAGERPGKNDAATDGELDIAFALLMARERWGGDEYLTEAKSLIAAIGSSLVRPDASLRLGDWNKTPGQTRPSDFMPVHFRAFRKATGDPLWSKVEDRSYEILDHLQSGAGKGTGLVPDFAIEKEGHWIPAKPGFLEGKYDGNYYYNACRVPWRIGWASMITGDHRAKKILTHFMGWSRRSVKDPLQFRAGYRLDGQPLRNSDYETACFISPTGVAAMALGDHDWETAVMDYAIGSRGEYYEDSLNLLCLLLMRGGSHVEDR